MLPSLCQHVQRAGHLLQTLQLLAGKGKAADKPISALVYYSFSQSLTQKNAVSMNLHSNVKLWYTMEERQGLFKQIPKRLKGLSMTGLLISHTFRHNWHTHCMKYFWANEYQIIFVASKYNDYLQEWIYLSINIKIFDYISNICSVRFLIW